MSIVKVPDDMYNDPSNFSIPIQYRNHIDNIILSYGFIKDRIEKMAEEICKEYIKEDKLVCVCILKGAFRFYCDLIAHLRTALRHSSIPLVLNFEFLQLSSYRNCTTTGHVNVLSSESIYSNFHGQNVLIVEDMIDSGTTMVKLLDDVKKVGPKSLKVVSLMVKRNPDSCGYKPDCFEMPNKYIVGYGADYNEYFRDMDHIGLINEDGKRTYAVPTEIQS